MNSINFSCRTFKKLSKIELYRILQLRAEVFVVEQNCPYLDADDSDSEAYHVMGISNNELVAYSRFYTSKYGQASIGRVVVSANYRGLGLGFKLMQEAERSLLSIDNPTKIHLSAQEYLRSFYETLGYHQNGDGYLEDNIPHIPMDKFFNT